MKKISLAGLAICVLAYFTFITGHAAFLNKNIFMKIDSTGDNVLSTQEKNEGWKLLFNGTTLDNFRSFKNKKGSWSVINGTLECHKTDDGQYADLITDAQYENFEFAIDWKIEPQANSGIMYLVTEQYEESFLSGPEYQLLDDEGYKGKIEDYQACGANYAMYAPAVHAAKPVGEWNHTIIKVNNGYVEHWLNGQKVVAYQLWSSEWEKKKATSKWKDATGYGASKSGHIALQDYHGNGKVWFKNIKIKMLE